MYSQCTGGLAMTVRAKNGIFTALGLMSGTSLDGVDAAILHTDGESIASHGPRLFQPYEEEEREALRNAIAAAPAARSAASFAARPYSLPPVLAMAAEVVEAAHLRAIEALLSHARLRPDEIDIIGFHGQTVLHAPDRGLTVQLGDGETIARRSGIDVAWDLRSADMAAGGQGAPLVPVYHRALAKAAEIESPVAIVNIGGVANITWIGEGEPLIAFDTGPGNALINDVVHARTGAAMDENGSLAAQGRVDENILAALLADSFFQKPPPKSLDRNDFSIQPVAGLDIEDAAATLTAFTAEALASAARHMPVPPARWIVTGGGARNPVLMAELAARVPAPGIVLPARELGWAEEFIEAEAFAFLAVRSLRGLPLTFPGTTGVSSPLGGGRFAPAQPGPAASAGA
jgi:anhydro-N-acetylmuramic acid kinase